MKIDVSKIDWERLKDQKARLNDILNEKEFKVTVNQFVALEAICSMINYMQEEAINSGMKKEDVYDLDGKYDYDNRKK